MSTTRRPSHTARQVSVSKSVLNLINNGSNHQLQPYLEMLNHFKLVYPSVPSRLSKPVVKAVETPPAVTQSTVTIDRKVKAAVVPVQHRTTKAQQLRLQQLQQQQEQLAFKPKLRQSQPRIASVTAQQPQPTEVPATESVCEDEPVLHTEITDFPSISDLPVITCVSQQSEVPAATPALRKSDATSDAPSNVQASSVASSQAPTTDTQIYTALHLDQPTLHSLQCEQDSQPVSSSVLTLEQRAVLYARRQMQTALESLHTSIYKQCKRELFLSGNVMYELIRCGGGLQPTLSALQSLTTVNDTSLNSYEQLCPLIQNLAVNDTQG